VSVRCRLAVRAERAPGAEAAEAELVWAPLSMDALRGIAKAQQTRRDHRHSLSGLEAACRRPRETPPGVARAPQPRRSGAGDGGCERLLRAFKSSLG
jgi:hypothetical protein